MELLRPLEVFHALSEVELAAVADDSQWLSLREGQLLFSAEATAPAETAAIPHGGGRLYVVRDGEVLITRRGDEGRDIALATFVAGEGFGELDLFQRPAAEDAVDGTVDATVEDSGETGAHRSRGKAGKDMAGPPSSGPSRPAQGAGPAAPAAAGGTGGIAARCERDTTLLAFPAPAGGKRAEQFFEEQPAIAAKLLNGLLAMVARRIRSTNRLLAEKSHWVQELRRQVSVDKLTGLYNASFLEEDLGRMVADEGSRVWLMMLKPDNFKTVNDTYGHQAGDRALQLMAEELRARLAGRGTAVRYRGDVLAAVLPACAAAEARRVAEAIRTAMKGLDLRELSGGRPLSITVSIGAAGSTTSGRRLAPVLVERAYENLFTARNAGGDRVCGTSAPKARRAGTPVPRGGKQRKGHGGTA